MSLRILLLRFQRTGDYDFNDVVLKTAVNNGQVTIALAAAGTDKELSAGYKVNGRDNILWSSVHEALGVSAGTIVNPGPSTLLGYAQANYQKYNKSWRHSLLYS